MSLNIKDAETDRLARALAKETGESITLAAKTAIEERLVRVRAHGRAKASTDLLEIVRRGRARQILDDRDSDEIVGYDAIGLPS